MNHSLLITKFLTISLLALGITHGDPFDKGGFDENKLHEKGGYIRKVGGTNVWYTVMNSHQMINGTKIKRTIYKLYLGKPFHNDIQADRKEGILLMSLPPIYNESLEFKVAGRELRILFERSKQVYLNLNLDALNQPIPNKD